MNKEKLSFIRDAAIVGAALLAFAFLVFKYLLPAVLPFVIAWSIAHLVRGPADCIAKRLRINKRIVRSFFAVLTILLLISAVVSIAVILASESAEILKGLGTDGTLSQIISFFASSVESFAERLGIESDLSSRIFNALYGVLENALSAVVRTVSAVAGAIPDVLLFIIVTLISAVYFAVQLEDINEKIKNILPPSVTALALKIRGRSLSAVLKYARSYLLIMLITFGVMLVGFLFIGIGHYSFALAALAAVVDILPVLGVGLILLPWAIFMLTVGENASLGIGLIVLWGVATVIRQVIEPKIVGRELGIHPLLTLVLMYAGYSVFGFVGLVLLPVCSIFFVRGKENTAEIEE